LTCFISKQDEKRKYTDISSGSFGWNKTHASKHAASDRVHSTIPVSLLYAQTFITIEMLKTNPTEEFLHATTILTDDSYTVGCNLEPTTYTRYWQSFDKANYNIAGEYTNSHTS